MSAIVEEVNVATREEIIIDWYQRAFPILADYIRKGGGDLEQAREIFQEAVVIYYEKSLQKEFSQEKDDKAYLLGIGRNLWRKHLRQTRHSVELQGHDLAEERDQKPLTTKILRFLQQNGEKCMNLLQAYYYEKLPMAQLADRFGYGSERSATVQKYKCLEKIRDQIKLKSLRYEDFLD